MFERRMYFIFGDLLSTMVAGITVCLVTTAVVTTAWPMLLAMSVTVFGSLALFFYAELPLTLARQLVGGL